MKQKRLKKYESEDSSEIRNLIIITVIIALIATGLYFLTEKVLNKKENNNTSEVIFNYDEATIGTMFNRPYDEYYAFIYDSTDDNSAVYNNIVKTYPTDMGWVDVSGLAGLSCLFGAKKKEGKETQRFQVCQQKFRQAFLNVADKICCGSHQVGAP